MHKRLAEAHKAMLAQVAAARGSVDPVRLCQGYMDDLAVVCDDIYVRMSELQVRCCEPRRTSYRYYTHFVRVLFLSLFDSLSLTSSTHCPRLLAAGGDRRSPRIASRDLPRSSLPQGRGFHRPQASIRSHECVQSK